MSKNTPLQDDVELGMCIRLRRRQIGWSQTQLAVMIGVTFQQVQKYEHGTNRVSYSRLVAIAAALECTVQDLTGETATGTNPLNEYAQVLTQPGTADLIRHYTTLSKSARSAVLKLAADLASDTHFRAEGGAA